MKTSCFGDGSEEVLENTDIGNNWTRNTVFSLTIIKFFALQTTNWKKMLPKSQFQCRKRKKQIFRILLHFLTLQTKSFVSNLIIRCQNFLSRNGGKIHLKQKNWFYSISNLFFVDIQQSRIFFQICANICNCIIWYFITTFKCSIFRILQVKISFKIFIL